MNTVKLVTFYINVFRPILGMWTYFLFFKISYTIACAQSCRRQFA